MFVSGVSPALTTKNYQMFLLSVADMDRDWNDRLVHRPMHVAERMSLMGHPPMAAVDFRGTGALRASGNAYAVHQAWCVTVTRVKAIHLHMLADAISSDELRTSSEDSRGSEPPVRRQRLA